MASSAPPQADTRDDRENTIGTEANSGVIVEEQTITVGTKIGACKWFNNVHGYGFLTIVDGEDKGTDVFVHHSGIKPSNSQYKTLKKGEYLTFDVVDGAQGSQAINVRGICGGPLLCDHIPVRKHAPTTHHLALHTQPPPPPRRAGGEHASGWTKVTYSSATKRGGGASAVSAPLPAVDAPTA
jgi:cold shock protein